MTIILFLVDTSASMCQKAYINGVQKSYLDIAKGAVETFLKYRQRSADCMGDRYMLLTFEDPPANVKAGWKENHGTFMNELKNLQSNGLTSMGEALRNAFDLLNLNRMQSGIDTYGQGRCPFYLEPSVIIVITDGGKYSFKTGVQQEIVLPLNTQMTGAKLTKEPFRWDQRLFSLVLRMAGNRQDERPDGKVPHDDSPIEKMCEVTGGRSYRVRSHHVLNQCIESLVQKVQPGVVVHFDAPLLPPSSSSSGGASSKDGAGAELLPDLTFGTVKKMIYVQKHPTQKTFPLGFWPIPEPYWPDNKATSLPARDAHPRLRICSPCVEEPPLVRNFPVDKYEVEPSPLTLQILCKREPTKCWPVFIANGIHGLELPFGYLKAGAAFTQVHLIILPYNYLTLLPLLNDLFHKFGLNPPSEWVFKFTAYVRAIPQYYGPFLRRALASASVPFQLLQYILPENLDSYLSPTMAAYLKTMKNSAKQEQENMCLRVFKQLKLTRPSFHQAEAAKMTGGAPLRRDLVTHPQLRETFTKMHAEIAAFEVFSITVPAIVAPVAAKTYRNPFEVPRRDLIEEIARMRENFMRLPVQGIALFTKDAGHSLPIADMGNYQEYLKNKQQPLREIEPTNVRQHMFGNPYKKDKHMVMVDEADVGEVGGGGERAATPPPMQQQQQSPPLGTKQQQLQQQHQLQQQQHQQQLLMLQQQQKKEIAAAVAASRPRKRKAGPIHRDYVFKRRPSDADADRGYCGSPSLRRLSNASAASGSGSSVFTDDDEDGGASSCSGADSPSSMLSSSSSSAASSGAAASDGGFYATVADSGHNAVDTDDDSNGELVIDFSEDASLSDCNEWEAEATSSFENGHGGSNGGNLEAAGEECRPVEPAGPPPPLPSGMQQHYMQSALVAGGPTIAVLPPGGGGCSGMQGSSNNGVVGASGKAPILNHHQHSQQQHHVHHPNGPPANDFQAQEISKILQQCTNGMDQPASSSSSGSVASNALIAHTSAASVAPAAHHRNHHLHPNHGETAAAADSNDIVGSSGAGELANHHKSNNSNSAARNNAKRSRSGNAAARTQRGRQPHGGRHHHGGNDGGDSEGNNSDESDDGGADEDEDDDDGGGGGGGARRGVNHNHQHQHNNNNNNNDDGGDNDDDDGDESGDHFNNGTGNEADRDTHSSSSSSLAANASAAAASGSSSAATNNGNSGGSRARSLTTSANHYAERRRSNRKTTAASTAASASSAANRSTSTDSDSDGRSGRSGSTRSSHNNRSSCRNHTVERDDDGGDDGDELKYDFAAADNDDEDDNEDGGETARRSNVNARRVIFRDIRRPGRDYTQLLEHLGLVRGCGRTRGDFVQMCVDESLRFRRKKMADTIRTWWDEQQLRQRQQRHREQQQQQQQQHQMVVGSRRQRQR